MLQLHDQTRTNEALVVPPRFLRAGELRLLGVRAGAVDDALHE